MDTGSKKEKSQETMDAARIERYMRRLRELDALFKKDKHEVKFIYLEADVNKLLQDGWRVNTYLPFWKTPSGVVAIMERWIEK